eukprot:gb/GECH01001867.1/.p1 GENE.gb/GECH01001867.1/~~gb/GECH01001867.1/.p1  ORF type:complete len:1280 (+),score=323.85 gb/GECH01001867.1/:1-3840(+)
MKISLCLLTLIFVYLNILVHTIAIEISIGGVREDIGIKQFIEDSLNNVTIKFIELDPERSFYREQYRTVKSSLKSQDPSVDIYLIDVIWPGDLAPWLVDLSEFISEEKKSEFMPSLLETDTVEGRLVALPFYLDAGILFYRKDLLTKYGFNTPPNTFDEIENMARVIQAGERNEGNSDFWGFISAWQESEGLTCDILEWIHGAGAENIVLLEEGQEYNITIDLPEARDALKRMASWVDDITPMSVLEMSEIQAAELYAEGNVAFMRNWPFGVEIAESSDTIREKYGTKRPFGSSYNQAASTIGGWHLAVNKASQNIETAIDVAKVLTSYDFQKFRALNRSIISALTDVNLDPEVCSDPRSRFICEIDWNLVPRPSNIVPNGTYVKLSETVYSQMNAVFEGKEDLSNAISSIVDNIQLLVGEKEPNENSSHPLDYAVPISISIAAAFIVIIGLILLISHLWKNKKLLQEQFSSFVEETPSPTSSQTKGGPEKWRLLMPSIPCAMITITIILVLFVSLTVTIISTTLNDNVANELGQMVKENAALRVKDATTQNLKIARALGRESFMVPDYAAAALGGFIGTIDITPDTKIFVIDRSGEVIVANGVLTVEGEPLDQSLDGIMVEAGEWLKEEFGSYENVQFLESSSYEFSTSSDTILFEGTSVSDASGLDWIIGICVPSRDIYEPQQIAQLIIIVVTVVILVIAFLISVILGVFLTRSLQRLERSMSAVTFMELDIAKNIRYSIFRDVFSMERSFKLMVRMLDEYKAFLPQTLRDFELEDATHAEESHEVENQQKQSTESVFKRGLEKSNTTSQYKVKNSFKEKESSIKYRHPVSAKSSDSSSELSSYHSTSHHFVQTGLELNSKLVTIIYVDIENFLRLSQIISPDSMVRFHQQFMQLAVKMAKIHRGIITNFSGDQLCIAFNAIQTTSTHCESACRCALRLSKEFSHIQGRFSELTQGIDENRPTKTRLRMGISTGYALAGNLGCREMRGFSILSPAVNRAAAMQKYSKNLGNDIGPVICQDVKKATRDNFDMRPLDIISLGSSNRNYNNSNNNINNNKIQRQQKQEENYNDDNKPSSKLSSHKSTTTLESKPEVTKSPKSTSTTLKKRKIEDMDCTEDNFQPKKKRTRSSRSISPRSSRSSSSSSSLSSRRSSSSKNSSKRRSSSKHSSDDDHHNHRHSFKDRRSTDKSQYDCDRDQHSKQDVQHKKCNIVLSSSSSQDDAYYWLKQQGFAEYAAKFYHHKFDGEALIAANEIVLSKALGIPVGIAIKIKQRIKEPQK